MSKKEKQVYQALREAFGASDTKSQEKIVRCKDCKFSGVHDGSCYPGNKHKEYIGRRYCIAWGDGYQAEWTQDDGFCHKAKPKESKR